MVSFPSLSVSPNTGDRDGLRGHARRERQYARRGRIVGSRGRRPVRRRITHADRRAIHQCRCERHGEHGVRRTAVAFRHRHVADGERGQRVVVENRAGTLGDLNRRVERRRQGEREGLVRFVPRIAEHGHGDGLRGHARRERQHARCGAVVGSRGRRAVGCRITHADRRVGHRCQRHGERRVRGAAVAFRHRHVADGQRGQRVVVEDRANP